MRTRMMMSSAAATATATTSNRTDRLAVGGHAAQRGGYHAPAAPAPAIDLEFSLGRPGSYGGGKGQAQPIRSLRMPGPSSPFSARACSLCNKHFVSLGAHQVSHRRELEMVRRRQRDPAAAGGKAPAAPSDSPAAGGRQLSVGVAASVNLELSLGCGPTSTGEPEEAAGLDLTLRL